ncbi:MAG: YceI family protein [Rubripirellula sp.]|nr:YceI family protein [Rubripirellula sp.]
MVLGLQWIVASGGVPKQTQLGMTVTSPILAAPESHLSQEWNLVMRCTSLFFLCIFVSAIPLGSHLDAMPAQGEKAKYASTDVELGVSRAYVYVDKSGLGHEHGVEAKLSQGNLRLGAEQEAGKLVFDMSSFDADTPAARKYVGLTGTSDNSTRATVNENMKGPEVLNVKRFPTATFQIHSSLDSGKVSLTGRPLYRLSGNFTLCGKTQPLSVMVEVEQARGWLHLKGQFEIKQTDYGIKPYSKAFGVIGVADELKIYGDVYVAPTNDFSLANIPERK